MADGGFLERVARERLAWAASLPPVTVADGPPPTPFPAIFDGVAGALIAEVKPVSPADGGLLGGRDPAAIAASFTSAGARALSVLTEGGSFGGSFDLLGWIASGTGVPVLAKDIVVHEIQVVLARNAGASAVLLIADLLGERELARLAEFSRSVGVEPLVEVHDEGALGRLAAARPGVVAVNARNLRSLAMEPGTHAALIGRLPAGAIAVAASGIGSAEQVRALAKIGYRGFLVGTSLMRAADPSALVRELAAAAEGSR